ncbi:PTS fructose transporter subunit IIB [Enterococcus sp. AZ126]|uniref:PTS fructose transporter subunit IIB n=1 Tax=Enterococcus sp. AZ126 TaxID=2774635 RepID=UPI003F2233B6
MKVVAVTACPTGVAHTYMAQEAIEKECKKRGYEVQVETQGSMGIENELEQEDVDAADVVILAVAIGIEGEERFDEKTDEGKVLQIDPSDAIKHPVEVLDKAEKLFKASE